MFEVFVTIVRMPSGKKAVKLVRIGIEASEDEAFSFKYDNFMDSLEMPGMYYAVFLQGGRKIKLFDDNRAAKRYFGKGYVFV